MNQPDYEQAVKHILHRLETELSPNLTYHSLYHTRDDVMPAAFRLAEMMGVNGEELKLLKVAAAFHDSGFLIQYEEHEIAGVEIAIEILPQFGFSREQINRVTEMILATRLPQSPQNPLEEILADADLDALGREDFFERGNRLREERARRGFPVTDASWYHEQIGFLEGHHYFTKEAASLRDEGKREHLKELKKRLRAN